MDKVVIGADPQKHSVTIEVLDERERVLDKGRYGYWQMLAAARQVKPGAGRRSPLTVLALEALDRGVEQSEESVELPVGVPCRTAPSGLKREP